MITKILQSIGDSIIIAISKAKDEKSITANYEMGLWFNDLCVNYFDVYLD